MAHEQVFGLLGRKLGHSWSVPTHTALGCRDYRLIELEPEALPAFVRHPNIGAVPYTHLTLPTTYLM